MNRRQGVRGHSSFEMLVVATLCGGLLIYFMHRMAVTAQAKVHVELAINAATAVEQKAVDYHEDNKAWPDSVYDMHVEPHVVAGAVAFDVDFSGGQLTLQFGADQGRLAGKTLVLKPRQENSASHWSCDGGTLDNEYRPKACLPYTL